MDDWIASGVYEATEAAHRTRVARVNTGGWKQPRDPRRHRLGTVRSALAIVLIALARRLAPWTPVTPGSQAVPDTTNA